MLPRWTAKYVTGDDLQKEKRVEVFGETIFQAWYNAMCLIQIIEKTDDYAIKGVNPYKTN